MHNIYFPVNAKIMLEFDMRGCLRGDGIIVGCGQLLTVVIPSPAHREGVIGCLSCKRSPGTLQAIAQNVRMHDKPGARASIKFNRKRSRPKTIHTQRFSLAKAMKWRKTKNRRWLRCVWIYNFGLGPSSVFCFWRLYGETANAFDVDHF